MSNYERWANEAEGIGLAWLLNLISPATHYRLMRESMERLPIPPLGPETPDQDE